MTSQSGREGEEASDEYRAAWASIAELAARGELSWSGRESNRVFSNLGGLDFFDVSDLTGAAYLDDGRAAAVLDWDRDGRQDLLLRNRTAPRLRLLLGRAPEAGNWLQLRLAGTASNRDAIGARVTVETEDGALLRCLRAGEGYLAQSSKVLHFGLGDASEVRRVVVAWPPDAEGGRREEVFTGLEPGHRWLLVEGSGEAVRDDPPPATALPDAPRPQPVPPHGERFVGRIPLVAKLPMQPLPLPSWERPGRTVADLRGGPVLVNLWSLTCGPCRGELTEFSERRDELAEVGLRLVPLELGADGESASGRELLASLGLDADAGPADARTLAALGVVLDEVLWDPEELPLPTSLLLDPQGNLVCVYQGPVDLDQLLRDAETAKALNPRSPLALPLCGGRLLTRVERRFGRMARQARDAGLPQAAALWQELAERSRRPQGGRRGSGPRRDGR